MGITRVANVTGLDSIGIPVVMVCRPNARSVAVAQGKGADLATARASGLMESVEGYHAETIMLPLRLCSYEELRHTRTVVDPWRLPRARTSGLSPETRLLWVEGRDLLNEESVFVPYELVHTDYRWPPLPGAGCFLASSNGLASGNHILEAISQGVCEVVERDATIRWSRLPRQERERTRIDPGRVDDPLCLRVLEKFESAGIEVEVWDTTTDVGLASFACDIRPRLEESLRPLPPAQGMGCHPSRSTALLRALTEAAQSRLTLISGSRDDLSPEHYAVPPQPPSASPAPGRGRDFHQVPHHDADTIDEDVEWELDRLARAGLPRVIAVDLTQAFGLPVVRIVVPGLKAPIA